MRLNYYGSGDWKDEPKDIPPAPPKAEPFGPVPGQEQPEQPEPERVEQPFMEPRRTPNAWTKPPRPERPRDRRSGSGPRRFGLIFALLLLLAGTGVILQGGVELPRLSLDGLWKEWDRGDSPDDWYGYDYDGENWQEELKDTTVGRAPAGDGTTLLLAPAEGESLSAGEIYERVNPSVVVVWTTLRYGYTMGTGVIMSSDGYIITNAHVIAGARELEVAFADDRRAEALLVGYDGDTDLAVLKVDAQDLPAAAFGDSAALRVGDPAYAIGNPLGEELRGTMTNGIISAIDRTVDMDGMDMTLLQTNAAINSGNSGGPLINAYGQVIGITNMKMMSEEETIEGLGFAIPTVSAKPVVDQIIAQGYYTGAPMLGVTVMNIEATETSPAGALISGIEENSDAYRKGLRVGQIITRANGVEIHTIDDLALAKGDLQVGDTITLEVWTGRASRVVDVKLMSKSQMEEQK